MNTQYQAWVAAVAALGLSGSVCLAEPTVVFADGPGNLGGGIYHATTSDHGSFDTFCVEVGEGLSFGVTYEYTLSTDITYNGNGTTNPLNAETAFLFTSFAQGTIRDILNKPLMPEDKMADAIQRAIWKIEGERQTGDADALALIAAAQNAISDGSWSGLGKVRVMNTWRVGHVGEQDFANQDTIIIIPLPSTAGLATLGILGLGVLGRHRR